MRRPLPERLNGITALLHPSIGRTAVDAFQKQKNYFMSRRVDDLGRIVIPKEIRRTLRIRESDPLLTTLTLFDKFCIAIHSVVNRHKEKAE